MSDHLLRVLSEDGLVRVCIAQTTELVEEIRHRQQSDPTATVAIGRLATGAALMSSLLKGSQRIALRVEGSGPLRRLQAEAEPCGTVRASLKQPVANLPLRQGHFDVANAIGKAGFLHVIKDLGLKEPYRGMVQLFSSEIAEDIAYYFTTSEQTPSSVGLGVELDQDGRVAVAGGFLLQLMPGAPVDLAEQLEARIRSLPPTTEQFRKGASPQQLAEGLLHGFSCQILGETPLRFCCHCSHQQSAALLSLLGREELTQMMEEQQTVTVTCEFCREVYWFEQAELIDIRGRL
ncbi:MAG: Hsp33 family molecular chaperone HslO [Desulfuromonas sp.]|nr:MAG: Hsp33 family molecular chaperone HslO [Desulfuromonas sp.]